MRVPRLSGTKNKQSQNMMMNSNENGPGVDRAGGEECGGRAYAPHLNSEKNNVWKNQKSDFIVMFVVF